jgi:hypothetical protein
MLPTASLSLSPHITLNASIPTVSHIRTTGARLPKEACPTPPCSHVSTACFTSFAARFSAMMRRTLFISLKGVGNTSCKPRYHHLTIKHHAAIHGHSRPRGAVMRGPAYQDRSLTRLNVPQQHFPHATVHQQQPFCNCISADKRLPSPPRRTTIDHATARAICVTQISGRQPFWRRPKPPFAPSSTQLPPSA